ncbi:CocE/NonD family hydrolase [Sphaerisporangium viridialbum]|uniref:CocE/NonD family hydrolase n=1 Tax=Sphaerisporangium viridialbum TaxID=46189 RepID=UPI003C7114C9
MRHKRTSVLASAALLCGLAPLAMSTPAQAAPIPTPDHAVSHEENARVPAGALWSEHYFPSSDGSDVELHADVLRPAQLPPDTKTPVILSIGPYFNHIGQTGNDGFKETGPSERFNDLINGASLMARGYTVVMVDLRGFGASTGCLDWVGPGEQADIKAAVDWAASQPWSTGKVGMYGKSYDAVTGLVGANQGRPGLTAVVASEPLWNMYNYLFSNGVRRPNYLGTPQAYNGIANLAGMKDDSDRYRQNAAYEKTHPECLANNLKDTQDPDRNAGYWKARDLAEMARGSKVPLFVTQGFIEDNTKPEDIQRYLTNHAGPKRGWLGQWEHVRGNETNSQGRLLMGRTGWFDEVMRFYDQYLKGIEPSVKDPNFLVEGSDGVWRAQDSWPVAKGKTVVRLEPGSYVDNGRAKGLVPNGGVWDMETAPRIMGPQEQSYEPEPGTTEDGKGYYSWSKPVNSGVRVTGTPRVSFTAKGTGNVLVRLWDVAPDGKAVMFDEQMSLVKAGTVEFDLKSADWTLTRGHQLAVGIGTNTSRSWSDTPSNQTITVSSASLSLELDDVRYDTLAQGDVSPFLASYLKSYTSAWTDLAPGTLTMPVVPLTVTASSRCVGTTAYVAVTAVNASDKAATATLTTPYGFKTLADVAPDKQAYQSFNARAGQIGADKVGVTGTATIDGKQVTWSYDAAYNAISCG